jgi:3-oxoacyl-[acyl-carrier protein] reductase
MGCAEALVPEAAPVTLITGSRKGIGRYLVEHFLSKGHRVFGCSRQPVDAVLTGYTHIEADVTDETQVRAVVSAVRKATGRIDNLINNAGIASMNHTLLTPVGTLNTVLQTNVVGTFLFCREAAKVMQAARYGRIVNFSSVAVPLRLEGEAAYAASKAAVGTLTEVMAREYGPLGITVNAVGPTPVETDLIRGVPKEKIDVILAQQAVRRIGTFEDVANVVDFFVAPASGFVTGQTIYLGGVA